MSITILASSIRFIAEFQAVHLLPAAGVLMIVTGLMMRYRKRRLRGSPCLSPQEQLERNKQLRGVRGDLEELMVEIEQFAKRLAAQLDAKSIRLEALIREAEQKAAELRRLSGGGGEEERGRASPRGEGDDAGSSGAARRVDGSGISAAGAPASSAGTMPEARPAADPPQDAVAKAVYQLAERGMTAPQIALQLKEHVGKIELILALRQPSRANL